MSNFYDEVCEYSYSTPVTENFATTHEIQKEIQDSIERCLIESGPLKQKRIIDCITRGETLQGPYASLGCQGFWENVIKDGCINNSGNEDSILYNRLILRK
jgi:hypothetical protein